MVRHVSPSRAGPSREFPGVAESVRTSEGSNGAPPPEENVGNRMFATIRRYESVDQSRTAELVKKVDETLLPRLSRASAAIT
jgi:hypothetical protein